MSDSELMFQGFSSVQVKQLKESAAKAFQILEPWFHAKPMDDSVDFPELHTLISGVKDQGVEFVKAIDLSLEAGQCAVNFAHDLNVVWESIAGGEDSKDIATYVDELRRYAHEAHESCEQTLRHFELVRKNIFELARTIPLTGELLLLKMRKLSRSERRHTIAANVAYKTVMLLKEAAMVSASVPSPIMMIVMPIALPILMLITKKIGDMENERASERKMEQVSLEEVARQLEKASNDLNAILGHLKAFTMWWTGAETELNHLSERLSIGGSDATAFLMLSKQRVNDVSRQFGDYLFEICQLKDMHFYPRGYTHQLTSLPLERQDPWQISPQKAITKISDEFIQWESALSKLRHAAKSISRRDIQLTLNRLDEMKEAMESGFGLHSALLRSLLGRINNHWATKEKNATGDTKDVVISCLENHITVSKLTSAHIPELKSYLSRNMPKRHRKDRRMTTGSLEVSLPDSVPPNYAPPAKDQEFLQSCVSTYTNTKPLLQRLEMCMGNVGTLYTVLAFTDYSKNAIERCTVEEALAAFSHLH